MKFKILNKDPLEKFRKVGKVFLETIINFESKRIRY